MYSESDIETAVASGALSPEAAAALRASVAATRAAPAVDEESFRLITGFNDIFVSIAAILLLVAVGWIGGSLGGALVPTPYLTMDGSEGAYQARTLALAQATGAAMTVSSMAVAAAAWALAEFFTRRRRMALPSIVLLAAFASGVAAATFGLVSFVAPFDMRDLGGWVIALAGLATAGTTYLHWRRFRVPITIAALTGALAATLLGLLLWAVPGAGRGILWLMLATGVATFAFAMWWDMSDRARITRRSDVAFWLHLGAAPLIAHPVFNLLGVMTGEPGIGTAVLVIALYILFGVIALAVDRRALLVSSLIYVLSALGALFRQFGAVSLNLALTALVIGSALLLLSAFWHPIRRIVVGRLPADLRHRLPELDRPLPTARPA